MRKARAPKRKPCVSAPAFASLRLRKATHGWHAPCVGRRMRIAGTKRALAERDAHPVLRESKQSFAVLACVLSLLVVACIDPGAPGVLVPPTVTEDPLLPQATVTVAGHERHIHVRTYGSATNPPLLIVHGSAADMRAYLVLAALADRYFVVFWDLRGNGLSERVGQDELAFDVMSNEIEAVRLALVGDRPVSIIGHSWGAVFVALYLAQHPQAVHQAVLIEPPGLTSDFQNRVGQALDLFAPGYLDMVYSTDLLSPTDHETLDYKTLMLLKSGIRNFSCDNDHPPPFPVWRPGGLALLVWENSLLNGGSYSYDFSPGLAEYPGQVLIVGTECSPLGATFQEQTNLTLFSHATLLDIPRSGHRVTIEQPALLLTALNAFLDGGGS
jgi:proline iminopeptidase